jgi:capsular polysaccharide biosynthesis protein
LLYLNKREEARISDALDTKRIVNVTIAEAPTVPAVPTQSPWTVVLMGTLLAVLVSAIVVFVAEYLDPSLHSAADVEGVLEMPLLAAMPRMQGAQEREKAR